MLPGYDKSLPPREHAIKEPRKAHLPQRHFTPREKEDSFMQLLKDRIRKDGKIKAGNVLKVDSFFKSSDGH